MEKHDCKKNFKIIHIDEKGQYGFCRVCKRDMICYFKDMELFVLRSHNYSKKGIVFSKGEKNGKGKKEN